MHHKFSMNKLNTYVFYANSFHHKSNIYIILSCCKIALRLHTHVCTVEAISTTVTVSFIKQLEHFIYVSFSFCIRQNVQIDSVCTKSYFIYDVVLILFLYCQIQALHFIFFLIFILYPTKNKKLIV